LHLITDLQQSASPLRFSDLEPPVNTQILIHDVSSGAATNWRVENVAVRGAQERVLTATLRAQGGDAQTRDVVLTIDEKEYARQRVTANNGSAEAIFTGIKLGAGGHRLRVGLEPADSLPQDDAYFAVIEHTEPTVLLITENPEADHATYFAAAIESQSALKLSVQHATPLTLARVLAEHPLNRFSAVVVADTGILSERDARRISEYVEAGGAALVTLGPKAAKLPAEPVTGTPIRRTSDTEQRISWVDDSHPVLRDAASWRAVRFMRHIEVRLPPVDEAAKAKDRTLISLEDGSALLVERLGEVSDSSGRLLLLAAPLDREWNDLAIHPLFVRFIAETARYLTGRDAAAMSHLVGAQIVTGLLPGATNSDGGGQIFDPTGRRVLGLNQSDQAARLAPDRIGFYEVRSNNQKRWLAVNSDRRESDLTPLSADNLTRWQALRRAAASQTSQAGPAAVATQPEARSLGFAILFLLAVLALAELLLGNYRLTIRRDGTVAANFPSRPPSQPNALGGTA